jgi:hypothetical protein
MYYKMSCCINALLYCVLSCMQDINALPGKLVEGTTASMPHVSLESLALATYAVLSNTTANTVPQHVTWQGYAQETTNFDRTVYAAGDYVIKVWQKEYRSRDAFLTALKVGFYNDIAQISALVVDDAGECRGYVSPRLIDRTYQRDAWNAAGFVIEKNKDGVSIFAAREQQSEAYKNLFDRLVAQSKKTGLVTLDLCPNNIALDAHGTAYLVDLEDVLPLEKLNDAYVQRRLFKYNAHDYLDRLHALKNNH